MDIIHDNAADLSALNGKTVAVIGYGAQGRAQALCMRDSGAVSYTHLTLPTIA